MKTVDLAKDIIFLCKKYGHHESKTKIHKLIYLILGFALINNIQPTEKVKDIDDEEIDSVIDELPKAWPYGPVFPKVDKNYNKIMSTDFNNYDLSVKNDPKLTKIVEETVRQWGKNTAGQLSDWSHEENSPWDVVVKQQGSGWNTPIPLPLVEEYFEKSVENILGENE
ncbi:Panacea domain-containing protein [Candidatus Deianiraea vastatrix]|uniref:Phage protein n=1 Tax=Candidatus Deianiraea vastatrix TaxID=2163644 RepID=A0A5B8XCS2_9RICK|nr:type II toxin-antitoxin system antitoxin SocA domain-containing protein [Candidatus Deianiraea vastatrix]QED23103.1 Putative phage protein [Candidatus Deianiraea vastatrix]